MDVRYWQKVERTEECWIWRGALNSNGYGVFWVDGGLVYAHRLMYEAVNGQIEDGLTIDHLCRNRACVNPDHLEAVEHIINCQRGKGSQTHCKRGHEFTEENTYVRKDTGHRVCRECKRDRDRKAA